MPPWAIEGDSPSKRIRACAHTVLSFPIFKEGTIKSIDDSLKFLSAAAIAIDSKSETQNERIVGELFRYFIITHVKYVRESWLELEKIIDDIIYEADGMGQTDWDVRIDYKVHKHLENMAESLDFVRDKINEVNEEPLKLLIGFSALFPMYEMLSQIIRNSFTPKGNNSKLKRILNKKVDKFVNLRWHESIKLDLERVRNNWGHGLGKFEGNYWMTPRNPNGTRIKYLKISSNDILEYIRVGSSVWIAFNLISLYKGTQGALHFN